MSEASQNHIGFVPQMSGSFAQFIMQIVQVMATGFYPQIFLSDQEKDLMTQHHTDNLEQRGIQISVSAAASPW